MRILWALSSVGKGHIMRDIAIVQQLQKMGDVEINWLAPDPARRFLIDKGYNVLECSAQLKGSGQVYEQVFKDCTDEFIVEKYIKQDMKLWNHDFKISTQVWNNRNYDIIVGDEAFWLLTGFSLNPFSKPAPFLFLTDFIGVKAMRPCIGDRFISWVANLTFIMSYLGPDVYIYIGWSNEIPNERFGFLFPNRQRWAQKHCRFVKPIISFDPSALTDKIAIKKQLGLPGDCPIFLALTGPEGDVTYRIAIIERTFELLKQDFPNAHFIIAGTETGKKNWIQYHLYLERLYEYFAVSDCAIIQSGYGKIAELAALGTPFIAIPLDYHFEQECFMAHRLKHYGFGKIITLRHHLPEKIAQEVKESVKKPVQRVSVDNGEEVSKIIFEIVQNSHKHES